METDDSAPTPLHGDQTGGDAGALYRSDATPVDAPDDTSRPRRRTRKTADDTDAPAPKPTRRTTSGPASRKSRESGISGLAERARQQGDTAGIQLPADPLTPMLSQLRAAIYTVAFDEALHVIARELALALAPAVTQLWITDAAPWATAQEPLGGRAIPPSMRLRAAARVATRGCLETGAAALTPAGTGGELAPEASLPHWPPHDDPLLAEVISVRRTVLVESLTSHPLARAWLPLLPRTLCPLPGAEAPAAVPAAAPGTLVALPLRARHQFLGVLAIASGATLGQRPLTQIEELAGLLALAADRDRLLSYSRSQEALAQTVVRHAPVAMAVITGPDHEVSLANPTFALLAGLDTQTHIAGKRLREVAPERAGTLAALLRLDAVAASGEPQAMIELPIHLDPELTYWNVTTSPLPGIPHGLLVAAVDVTRQVIARQRSQESADLAQERIGQMIALHATSLDVSSQLGADPSELLADILRRSISLLNGRAGTVYVRDVRRDELEVVVSRGLRGDYSGTRIRIGEGLAGQVARAGQGIIVDDYRAYPFRASIYNDEDFRAVIAVPLVSHGQVVGVLDVLDDSERRTFTDDDLWLLDLFAAQAAQAIENARTYVELEHAYRKQRDLDRMKDDFIATASHELRTPLTGVQGFLDLLLDYPGSRDDALALDFLRKAVDSAEELADISERLLQTSRLDTGRIELHVQPVRLAQVVDEALRSFRTLQQAQGTTHELIAEVPQDIYVHADLGRLKEVLDNLIGNAVKYSPRGGQVTVRCAPFRVSDEIAPLEHDDIEETPTLVLRPYGGEAAADDGPTWPSAAVRKASANHPFFSILVSDQGMGIPSEEQSRLFGRFSRTEAARASQIRGTGLGLYICRQIMRAMGGDVWLHDSTPGEGSIFALALPAALDVENAQATAPLASVPSSHPFYGA